MVDELVEVRLLELPVALHAASASRLDGLQRELELIRLVGTDGTTVPDRLHSLIAELTDQFGGVGDQPRAEIDAAIVRGDAAIDLVYRITSAAGQASQRLGELLDELDVYCRTSGHLLTLVTPDEEVTYRRWFLGEFIGQTDGGPALPWPSYRESATTAPGDHAAPPVVHARTPAETGWVVAPDADGTTIVGRGPLDLGSAPSLRELLVSATSIPQVVTIDLRACDFMDSVGVSVLVAAMIRADEQGSELRFRLSEPVRRVLRISGLLEQVTIVSEP